MEKPSIHRACSLEGLSRLIFDKWYTVVQAQARADNFFSIPACRWAKKLLRPPEKPNLSIKWFPMVVLQVQGVLE